MEVKIISVVHATDTNQLVEKLVAQNCEPHCWYWSCVLAK